MTTITAIPYSTALERIPSIQASHYRSAESPFPDAFAQLFAKMAQMSQESDAYYADLAAKTKLSQEASELLRNFSTSGAQQFLNNQHVPLPAGVSDWSEVKDEATLKQALDDFKTAQTDFVAESQLKIGRVMQNYNTAISLTNSLQTILSELNKSLIQAMR